MHLDDVSIKHIKNVLRYGTLTWPGREEAFKRASKQVWEGRRNKKTGKKIWKTYWSCAKCKKSDRDKLLFECDHIVEVGRTKLTKENFKKVIADFILAMYCPQENLQILCIECHQKKTSGWNATLRFERKK